MDIKLNFDKQGLQRELERATAAGIADIARSLQRTLDRLGRECQGQPVDEIKPTLQREWRKVAGGEITDPDLTTYAEHLSAGTRITVRSQPVRL